MSKQVKIIEELEHFKSIINQEEKELKSKQKKVDKNLKQQGKDLNYNKTNLAVKSRIKTLAFE